jgi:TonB family protein
MNDAELRAAIDEIDKEAAENPAAYQRRLVMLALYGYAYMFAMTIGLLLLVAFILWILWYWHAWVLIKWSWLLLFTVWLVVKSMWVKMSPPAGVPVARDQAPALYALIDQAREAAKGPKIHEVLVNDEFNCGICELPRFGLVGFHKNTLFLGLPLMEALSEKEFASVLGHEMGHLSERHGRIDCWIHHVYASWIQIYQNLERESAVGNSLFRGFAEWFVPHFDICTLALRRVHEYAADQIAASIVGPETTAQALISISIRGSYLAEKFWPSILKQAQTSPEPPKAIQAQLSSSLHEPLEADTVYLWIKRDWRKHDLMNSHPALSERVRALLPDKDWSDLRRTAEEFVNTERPERNAAEALLGDTLTRLRSQLDELWHKSSLANWQEQHEAFKKDSEDFKELEELFNKGELPKDQVGRLAGICSLVKNDDEAIEFLKIIIDRYPDEVDPYYLIGLHLLSKKLDEGITYLDKAMDLGPWYGIEACRAIAGYLDEQDRTSEAERYRERSKDVEESLITAHTALTKLTSEDTFEEHGFPASTIEKLHEFIQNQSLVKEAYLVRKVMPSTVIKFAETHVLVVTFIPSSWAREEEQNKALHALAAFPECSNCFITSWENAPSNLADACKRIPGALVYHRKGVEGLSFLHEHLSWLDKRRRYYLMWAGACALGLLGAIFVGLNTHKQPAAPSPQAEQARVQYGNYGDYMNALQRRIKTHWFPPKQKESNHVVVIFKIHRDGSVEAFRIKQSSGNSEVDAAARKAVEDASPLDPLPPGKDDSVDIQYSFDYNVFKRPLGHSD